MNRKTHQPEACDEFCREIVHAARASEEEIHAAANAPFLYHRLRAQIAAEQIPIATIAPPRSSRLNFAAVFGLFPNRWAWVAGLAVVVLALATVQWREPAAPPLAAQQPATPPETAQTTTDLAPTPTQPERAPTSAQLARKPKATKSAPGKSLRVVATIADEVEEAEIATEFLPLTYTANRDHQRTQIVRMEMPRSVLATMGVPTANVTGDRVKADVMLGEDGVALAIRFIQEQ
jgi:hypothetical protein